MQINTFKGSYFEIGKQLGKIYQKNGMDLSKIKVNKKLLQGQIKVYKEFYPEIFDELKGINSVLNADEDKLYFFFLAGELDWFRRSYVAKACTIFGVKSKNGIFVGRNYDWSRAAEEFFKIYKVEPSNKNKYIAVTDMAFTSRKSAPTYLFYYEDDAIKYVLC